MEISNIQALLSHAEPSDAPEHVQRAALQEAFGLVVGIAHNIERIAGALEMIALNTHPTAHAIQSNIDFTARVRD